MHAFRSTHRKRTTHTAEPSSAVYRQTICRLSRTRVSNQISGMNAVESARRVCSPWSQCIIIRSRTFVTHKRPLRVPQLLSASNVLHILPTNGPSRDISRECASSDQPFPVDLCRCMVPMALGGLVCLRACRRSTWRPSRHSCLTDCTDDSDAGAAVPLLKNLQV